jgi:hypothetical protein
VNSNKHVVLAYVVVAEGDNCRITDVCKESKSHCKM